MHDIYRHGFLIKHWLHDDGHISDEVCIEDIEEVKDLIVSLQEAVAKAESASKG